MSTITKIAKTLAEKTEDAYSSDRYVSWVACAQELLNRGYTVREAEAILRSKHMRWCADSVTGMANAGHLGRYIDNGRNGLNATEVAGLVAGTV